MTDSAMTETAMTDSAMTDTTTDLHYDVRGTGPVLLVVPGGAGHPMGFDRMTDVLADRFTVVTYDPLGLAHGRLGEPVGDQRVRDWSDGARRVLDEVLPEGGSAYVLGTSSGAIAVLDLLARHPERLRHVVAHEPPCVGVLPDGARHQAAFREVYDVYRAAGLQAAGARLGAVLTGKEPEAEPESEPEPESESESETGPVPVPRPVPGDPQPLSREQELANPMALFLAHVLRPFTAYEPDLTVLTESSARLTLAAGADSRGQLLHRTAQFLSRHTGGSFAEFPGGHVGVAEHPAEFARLLAETLVPVGDSQAPHTT